jgi:hypothetical protein
VTRADWVLAVLALVLLAILYSVFWHRGAQGEQVEIWAAGQKPMMLPLNRDRLVHVHGALGDSVIEIRNGKARFHSSPCSTKICIHAGWQSRGGETAACLPNRVSIEIIGDRPEYDSINF